MTTKKIVIIVVSIVVVLVLLVVLFVGGIIGVAFYSLGNSEATKIAQEFLKDNERLKRDIGDVKSFGSFVTGNINIQNGDGTAQLSIKVIGERKTVNASVELVYRSGHPWRVTAASYKDDSGETVDLFNPYDARMFRLDFVMQTVSLRAPWSAITERKLTVCVTTSSPRRDAEVSSLI
jgi:hypothetical protein